jgi:hypothetical protein
MPVLPATSAPALLAQCSRRLPSAQECGACGVEIALVDQRLRFARNRADSSAFSI